MNKKLIAGFGAVSSLAVALAPVATFAAVDEHYSDAHTDELVVTVSPSCTFGTTTDRGGIVGVGHTATDKVATSAWNTTQATGNYKEDDVDSTGEGTTYDASADSPQYSGNHSEHTASGEMQAGTVTENFAKTTLKVVCNSASGYTVKASAANLLISETGRNDAIEPKASFSATASGYKGTMTQGAASSTAGLDNNGAIVSTGETPVAHNTDVSDANGDTYEVTYGIGVATSQRAGTYHGKVTYTLYQGA